MRSWFCWRALSLQCLSCRQFRTQPVLFIIFHDRHFQHHLFGLEVQQRSARPQRPHLLCASQCRQHRRTQLCLFIIYHDRHLQHHLFGVQWRSARPQRPHLLCASQCRQHRRTVLNPASSSFTTIDIFNTISSDWKYSGLICFVPCNADNIDKLHLGNTQPAYEVAGGVPEAWSSLLSPHFNKF